MTPILITLPILLLLTIGVVNSWYLEKEIPPNESNYPDLYDIPIIYDYSVNEEFNNEIKKNVEPFKSEDLKQKKSGPFSTKKCTVRKRLIIHHEDGFEYIPKHYHDYECVPVSENNENHFANQDTCQAVDCRSIHKTHTFLKKKIRSEYDCWQREQIIVNAGCDCKN